jgi:hypothetical protein
MLFGFNIPLNTIKQEIMKYLRSKTKHYLIKGLLGLMLLLLSSTVNAQIDSEGINPAFQLGEKLTFKLYYRSAVTGNVSAGELISEIKPNFVILENHPNYHVVMEGNTKGAFNWFFKIRDRFESYIDKHELLPRFFKKRIQEGDYKTQRDVSFNQTSGTIAYHNLKNGHKGVVKTDLEVQDLVSSLYYIRNWDFSNAVTGNKYYLNIFLDDSVYQIQFEYLGLADIETDLGKKECLKFKPEVLTGGVFGEESPMTIYVTNDRNHLPLLVVSKVMVGSVRMELKEYSGLKYDLSFE